eukprot:CAMPEP_0195058246 /NCGR_PEP_ID=MMETSP0448-20130528/6191_1 /TAXON_ID=66468 /ORGANISM="Heterocapsa triquestra, Strain CCMP 448" /LENGTH=191 /DNA_ID=CAMNT_0040088385 /DNA_START=98 /DNA_END=670 /DNA_ORIENTATION=+
MAMCDINIDLQNMAQGKREALLSASISEEETATQTPRSALNSYNDSAVETPRSAIKSGDFSPYDGEDDDDGDDAEYDGGEGDYYAFLRDFAGSFEAQSEDGDSESESGSEDGATDEEEEDEPSGTKGTSVASAGVPNSGLVPPPKPAACGWAGLGGGATKRGEEEKEEAGQELPSEEAAKRDVEGAPSGGR